MIVCALEHAYKKKNKDIQTTHHDYYYHYDHYIIHTVSHIISENVFVWLYGRRPHVTRLCARVCWFVRVRVVLAVSLSCACVMMDVRRRRR